MEARLVLLVVSAGMVTTLAPDKCNQEMDLVFLVDSSESIREDNPFDESFDCWTLLKEFISKVADNFQNVPQETKIGVVKFSTRAETEFDLQQHRDINTVKQGIENMAFLGENTNLARGLEKARLTLATGGRNRKILVVITDALVNLDNNHTYREAQLLKNDSILIISVGLTKEHNPDMLRAIATTWDNYLQADGFQGLIHLVKPVVYLICEQAPIPVCKKGEYFDGFICRECGQMADLALLVDDSGSIREKNQKNGTDNYVFIKIFLKNLVLRLPKDRNKVRLGILRFAADRPTIELHLNNNYTREEQEDVIDNMAYESGGTYTGSVLHKMRMELFRHENGDRPSVLNIAMVVTDGESWNKSYTLRQAELAKNEGVRFFTVGITNLINATELKLISSSPTDEHFYQATEFKQLNGLVSTIIKQVCKSRPARVKRSLDYTFMEKHEELIDLHENSFRPH